MEPILSFNTLNLWSKHYTVRFKTKEELDEMKDKLKLTKRHIWIENVGTDGSIYVEMSIATMLKIEKLQNEKKVSNVGR